MDWAGNGWTKVSHAPPGEHHSDHQASNNATKQRGETSEQTIDIATAVCLCELLNVL
jgi:hypothetical protein